MSICYSNNQGSNVQATCDGWSVTLMTVWFDYKTNSIKFSSFSLIISLRPLHATITGLISYRVNFKYKHNVSETDSWKLNVSKKTTSEWADLWFKVRRKIFVMRNWFQIKSTLIKTEIVFLFSTIHSLNSSSFFPSSIE